MTLYELLREITLNNQDEQGAIVGYYDLWNKASQAVDDGVIDRPDYDMIVEVVKIAIAEELKHANLLNQLSERLSKIKAEDSHAQRNNFFA